MNKAETVISIIDQQIPILMEQMNLDRSGAENAFLDYIVYAYMKQEDDVDVLDLAIAFTLLGKIWQNEINIKVFHDIYHSKLYEEVGQDVEGFSHGICPQLNLPIGLAEKYLDYLYKKSLEDTDTFLWRCLCLGCFPDAKFLRMTEEQKHDIFTKDVGWVLFENLFQMDPDDIDTAINLSDYSFEITDTDPTQRKEA